jgi:D-alanyl-D-alanine carboxypeptidase (penicillin-binding protein 5/6)
MAEFIAGTEDAFVDMVNSRAAELGMLNTNFTNCSGLIDDESHLTTARDIAIMSRELIMHEMVKAYTTIWMDTIRDGQFGLSNTNKLIYYYDGATGLKTGFTQEAMYCLSATAERDGVEYIAVILHGQTSQQRFEDAKTLLNYAFANYTLISSAPEQALSPIPVKLGRTDCIQPVPESEQNILIDKSIAADITKDVELVSELSAPVAAGDIVGTVTVRSGGEIIGEYPLVADQSVEKVTWFDIFLRFFRSIYTGACK